MAKISIESLSEYSQGFGVEGMTLEQRIAKISDEYNRYPADTIPFDVVKNMADRYGVTTEELFAHLPLSKKNIINEETTKPGIKSVLKKIFGGKEK